MQEKLLSPAECARLLKYGIHKASVSQYAHRKSIPRVGRLEKIIAILGRNPWEGITPKPFGRPSGETSARAVGPNPCPTLAFSFQGSNPCEHDVECLAKRTREMQPVPNLVLDQRREIPCTNCRRGIERARMDAARRAAPERICGCGEPKKPNSERCHACQSELRRATA